MIYILCILLNHPNSEATPNSKITGAYYGIGTLEWSTYGRGTLEWSTYGIGTLALC